MSDYETLRETLYLLRIMQETGITFTMKNPFSKGEKKIKSKIKSTCKQWAKELLKDYVSDIQIRKYSFKIIPKDFPEKGRKILNERQIQCNYWIPTYIYLDAQFGDLSSYMSFMEKTRELKRAMEEIYAVTP